MRFSIFYISLLISQLLLAVPNAKAQYQKLYIAHYNVENLFDTIDDPKTADEDFLPKGSYEWTQERYEQKLKQLGKVIADMNEGRGPDILGLCEVENEMVVAALAKHLSKITKKKYGYVHYNSPDGRGIDVAMLYNRKAYKVKSSRSLYVPMPGDSSRPTRDVLVVSGELPNKSMVHVLVNHWPSRRAGQDASEIARMSAAAAARKAVDSLHQRFAGSAVLVMGDFNDTPVDKAPLEVLGAVWPTAVSAPLANPFLALHGDSTQGSYRYRNNWQFIDHISISPALLKPDAKVRYVAQSAGAVRQAYQLEQEGRFKGNPFRTYAGNRYLGGYSDHLPVKIELEWRK
ncbi:MAG: endonuclease [Sphingobacteriaceae bacterium]|nr:endonuclease [Sphingobacteriaceae bacterium]